MVNDDDDNGDDDDDDDNDDEMTLLTVKAGMNKLARENDDYDRWIFPMNNGE